jgi:hypothetical protein
MIVDENKREKRLSTCMGCEFHRKSFKIFGITIFKRVSQCSICKCSILGKIMWEDSKCPKGKW